MNIHGDLKGERDLLLGNEAIARGVIEGGVDIATSYPGTPSSEVMETLADAANESDFHAEWSTNEKVAFDVAAGAAIIGQRSTTIMKNAGLNVVMDLFNTIVYGGVRGGFVIVVADDPAAHYSSNEQDSRFAADWAEIPCLEPADQQEAKDMTAYAFDLSEKLELPVLLRTVSRVSHGMGDVEFGDVNKEGREPAFDKHWGMPYRWNVYGPPGPVEKHRWLKSRQSLAAEESESLEWNYLKSDEGGEVGLIASGIGASYAREAVERLGLEGEISLLKLGISNPLPKERILSICREMERVVVVEEGQPLIERKVGLIAKEEGLSVDILGKTTGLMEDVGELSPDGVMEAIGEVSGVSVFGGEIDESVKREIEGLVAPRSSTFCAGCPHLGTFWAVKRAIEKTGGDIPIVNGDIGCYEMAGYGVFSKGLDTTMTGESQKYRYESPYELIDTNYVMGSGIGLMQGQFQAGYDDGPVIGLAGDSTFFHSCLPAVINAVYNGVGGLFIILDNSWTAMTGHQPSPCTGMTARGDRIEPYDIREVVEALGVEDVRAVDPYDLDKSTDAVVDGIERDGQFSVVISKRECTIQALKADEYGAVSMEVDAEECVSCGKCVELGCPAITFKDETGGIDWNICVGCGLCVQVCPTDALKVVEG